MKHYHDANHIQDHEKDSFSLSQPGASSQPIRQQQQNVPWSNRNEQRPLSQYQQQARDTKKASSSHEAIDPTVTSDARAPGLNPESAVHPNARVRPLTTEPTARPGAEAIDGPGSLRPPIQPESRLREDETDLVSAHLVEGDEQRQQHIPGPLVMASPMEEAPREDDYHVSRRDMKRYCIIGGSMILLVLVGIVVAVVLPLNNQSSSPIVSAGSSPSTPVPTFAPHVLPPSQVEPTFSLPPTDNDKEPSPPSTTTALPTSVSTGVTGPLPTVSPTRISTSAPITPPPTSFPTTLPPTPMPTPPPSPAPTPLPTPEPSAALTPPPTPEPSPPLTPPPTPEPSPPLTPPPTPEPTPPLTPPPTPEPTLLPTPRPTSVCDSNPCVNGDCVDKGDSFECDCFDLWTGDLCDEQTSPCNPNPCVHGECTVTSNGIDGYECDCDEGWYGYDDCSVNIYERCNPNPCASGELCLPEEDDIDDIQCVPDPCESCINGDCARHGDTYWAWWVDQGGSFDCNCFEGWSGDLCTAEIIYKKDVPVEGFILVQTCEIPYCWDCYVVQGDSVDQIDAGAPQCTACVDCSHGTVSIDCSNLSSDPCAVTDCGGFCIG